MTFDGENIEDLSNAELAARISNMWDLTDQCLREGQTLARENREDFGALIDELICRQI